MYYKYVKIFAQKILLTNKHTGDNLANYPLYKLAFLI
jgi:hypothetical protein